MPMFKSLAGLRAWSAVAALAAASLAAAAPAQTRTEGERRNLAIVERTFRDWAAGRGSIFDLLAPDSTWTILGPTPSARTYDRAQLDRDVLAPFNAKVAAPLRPKLRRLYADGDTVIALFEASTTRKDGAPYTNAYAWFMRFRGERIAEVTAVLDLNAYDAVVASGPR